MVANSPRNVVHFEDIRLRSARVLPKYRTSIEGVLPRYQRKIGVVKVSWIVPGKLGSNLEMCVVGVLELGAI